jgi:aryl-alcohol dehydrogenase-like predicted oxidoreductase
MGLCEVSAATLRRAHAVHPIAALQIEYNPFCLEIESSKTDLLRTCRELGVAIVAYAPIGRGLLTGQIKSPSNFPENDYRALLPKFSSENFPKILDLVHKLEDIAKSLGATPAQVCIAWLLARGPDIIPIPGTRKIKYLEENTNAAKLHLNDKELSELQEAIDRTELEGGRYPPA